MISIHTVSTAEINPFWSAIPILFAAAQLFICFESQLLGLMIASVTLLPIIRLFAFYHATTAIALLLAGLITLAVITMVSNKRHLLLMSGVFIALAAIMFLLGPNPVEMLTQALEPRFEFAHDTIPNILAAPGSDPAMTSPFTDLKATEYLSWCDNCFMLSEVVARFGLAKVLFVCTPLIGMLLTGGVVAVVSKDTYSTARVISYVSLAAPTILYFLQNLGVETVILNEVPLLTSGFMGSMLSTILVWQISVPESMLPAGDRRMYRIPAKVQAWFNGELEDEDDDDEDEE